MSFKMKSIMVLVFSIISFIVPFQFNQINRLLIQPLINSDVFLSQYPDIKLNNLIIQQPTSTFFILLLTIITVGLGIYYLKNKNNQFSFWLGINFIFWGIGAFLAGLSYQAFGYYLKCTNLEYCTFTNWVELLYMTFTVISINALLVAYSYLINNKKVQDKLQNYAIISVVLYSLFQGVGIILPNQFMISYEGMLLFLSPNIIIMMWINYQNLNEALHKQLWIIWLLFLGVNIAYFVALFSNQGSFLYSNFNIWFNENDTLHVLLIIWMLIWRWKVPNNYND
ncbi:MAG: hypothetical protein ACYDEI_02550 [Erysipelotrichaceae bacterium]